MADTSCSASSSMKNINPDLFDDGTNIVPDGAEELFEKWLLENGAQHDKILWPTRDTVGGVRGATALDDIETNEFMLSIPKKLMITPPLCHESELEPIFVENPDIFIDEDRCLGTFHFLF